MYEETPNPPQSDSTNAGMNVASLPLQPNLPGQDPRSRANYPPIPLQRINTPRMAIPPTSSPQYPSNTAPTTMNPATTYRYLERPTPRSNIPTQIPSNINNDAPQQT